MLQNAKLLDILDRAQSKIALTRDDCKTLLQFSETSYEAGLIRVAALEARRALSNNTGMILAQIGIDVKPCPASCAFCSFGEGHTSMNEMYMDEDELAARTGDLCTQNDLYGLFLMVMHDYNKERLFKMIETARKAAPEKTEIWVNAGDTDIDTFKEMRKRGACGVYHVCRLGEGNTTKLKPEARIQTMHNALDAGMKLYTCLEPIGPEHSIDELVDNMYIGLELPIFIHAAMRRVTVPGSPLAKYGMITNLRLAQIVAVVALAGMGRPSIKYIGVHEPHELSCAAGANSIFAESGVNPRDTVKETTGSRGWTMDRCRQLLWDTGWKVTASTESL
jgi:biotin synthase